MIAYIVYLVVFFILTYVLVIAVKAISRGIEAKQNNKIDSINVKKNNINLIDEINELKQLHSDRALNDEEFKKAKEKILK